MKSILQLDIDQLRNDIIKAIQSAEFAEGNSGLMLAAVDVRLFIAIDPAERQFEFELPAIRIELQHQFPNESSQ